MSGWLGNNEPLCKTSLSRSLGNKTKKLVIGGSQRDPLPTISKTAAHLGRIAAHVID